jgi:hypothetical protein
MNGILLRRTEWIEAVQTCRMSPLMFSMAVLVVTLNISDAVFTRIILEHGGHEVNPLARAAIASLGENFWIWKYALVSLSVILLSGNVHLRLARVSLALAAFMYTGVTVWQLFLLRELHSFFH